MLHFGYGSNLNQEFLRIHCPSARFIMKAFLPNQEVQFRFWSDVRNGGISTIVPAPGELVHGVIYEVEASDLERLDVLESVPQGLYSRDSFLVLGEDQAWHKADLYRVTEPRGPFAPARSYVELMLTGAKERGLDPVYVKRIEGMLEQSE